MQDDLLGKGERALVFNVLWLAYLDACNGCPESVEFLTSRSGCWAESRLAWLSHTNINPGLFLDRMTKLLPRPAQENPRSQEKPRFRAGTRMAQVYNRLLEKPRTLRELAADLDCEPKQVANALDALSSRRGVKFVPVDGKFSIST